MRFITLIMENIHRKSWNTSGRYVSSLDPITLFVLGHDRFFGRRSVRHPLQMDSLSVCRRAEVLMAVWRNGMRLPILMHQVLIPQ
jgi:hypothetical protein